MQYFTQSEMHYLHRIVHLATNNRPNALLMLEVTIVKLFALVTPRSVNSVYLNFPSPPCQAAALAADSEIKKCPCPHVFLTVCLPSYSPFANGWNLFVWGEEGIGLCAYTHYRNKNSIIYIKK